MATNITVITGSGTTTYTVNVDRRGPVGATGPAGPPGEGTNSITSATTSDGTAALYLDSIRFETTNGGPTLPGQMAWESNDGSIDAMLESGVIVAMGEDLLIRVRNATASPIAKGAALAYDGTQGASGRLEVKPWVGSNISTAKLFLGFAAAAIPANSNGYAQWFGKLDGINTSGGGENWQDEQLIYAVPGTSSTLTNVAPTSGEYGAVAVVVNAGSGTSGILFIRPTFERATYPPSAHTHVTADITDATSDGQTNPGKLLKTDANGALQINTLSLGSSDIDATDPGELIIYNATDVESVYGSIKSSNLTTARDFELPNTSGTIMVGANNLSEITDASAARTNLGFPAPLAIQTEADSFTLSQATHAGKWVRLTKASGTTTITLPTGTEITTGHQFFFFRAGAGALAFSGGTVAGSARLADVVENSAFGLVYRGSGNYDFV